MRALLVRVFAACLPTIVGMASAKSFMGLIGPFIIFIAIPAVSFTAGLLIGAKKTVLLVVIGFILGYILADPLPLYGMAGFLVWIVGIVTVILAPIFTLAGVAYSHQLPKWLRPADLFDWDDPDVPVRP